MHRVRKVLILAAGYGSRLERDIREDSSGKFSHLVGVPKPLLPLCGKPLISHWFDLLLRHGFAQEHIHVITNAKYHDLLAEWSASVGVPVKNVVNDGTTTNEGRLGAVRDIELAVERLGLRGEPLLVIGGDTLFGATFSLEAILDIYDRWQDGRSLIVYYRVRDSQVNRTGIIEVDDSQDNRVTSFLEKPDPAQTESRFATPCFYLFRPQVLARVSEYLEACGGNLALADAPGNFVQWIVANDHVGAIEVQKRIDVGRLSDYISAERYLSGISDDELDSQVA